MKIYNVFRKYILKKSLLKSASISIYPNLWTKPEISRARKLTLDTWFNDTLKRIFGEDSNLLRKQNVSDAMNIYMPKIIDSSRYLRKSNDSPSTRGLFWPKRENQNPYIIIQDLTQKVNTTPTSSAFMDMLRSSYKGPEGLSNRILEDVPTFNSVYPVFSHETGHWIDWLSRERLGNKDPLVRQLQKATTDFFDEPDTWITKPRRRVPGILDEHEAWEKRPPERFANAMGLLSDIPSKEYPITRELYDDRPEFYWDAPVPAKYGDMKKGYDLEILKSIYENKNLANIRGYVSELGNKIYKTF